MKLPNESHNFIVFFMILIIIINMNNKKFISKLSTRFSLRIHMTLILMSAAIAGLIGSKVMLLSGLHNPAIRYPVTVLFAYCVFFIAIKVWLWIITPSFARKSNSTDTLSDIVIDSLPLGSSGSSGSSGIEAFNGGGGQFAGGGASGSFGEPVSGAASVSSSGSSSGSGFFSSLDIDFDEGIGVVIVLALFAVLLTAIFGAGAYIIYQAPVILSEAAFDSLLAMSLIKKTKAMQDPDWLGSVFKATWKQFCIIISIAFITGLVMRLFFPEAVKISEIIKMLLK